MSAGHDVLFGFAAVLAGAGAKVLSDQITRAVRERVRTITLKPRGGRRVELPTGSDLASQERRLTGLYEIDPRLMLLEGWVMIEAELKSFTNQDVSVREFVDVGLREKIERIKRARNSLVHKPSATTASEIPQVSYLVEVLAALKKVLAQRVESSGVERVTVSRDSA